MIKVKYWIFNRRGFTFLEILTALIILGALTGLAYPNFVTHIEKTRSTEAIQILESLHKAQVAFFYENNAYTSTLADLDVEFPNPQSYNAPTVSTTDPIASIVRSTGAYTIRVNANGSFSCVGGGGICSKLGY